jgi:hypothetical protein
VTHGVHSIPPAMYCTCRCIILALKPVHMRVQRDTRALTHTNTHTHTPRWSLKPKCMTSLGPGSLYGYSVTASLLHPLQRGISGLTSDVSSVTETNTKVISAKSSCWNTRMNGKGKGTVRHWVWNLYIQGYGSMKLYFMIYYYNHNIINILINIIKSYLMDMRTRWWSFWQSTQKESSLFYQPNVKC